MTSILVPTATARAHLLRDLTFVPEHQQDWAGDLKAVLLGMYEAAREWRERGASRLPLQERDEWVGQYFDVLARGFAAQPPPTEPPRRRQGRRKQSAAKHVLDDVMRRAEQVLAFLDELTIPVTNHQAERDLRMVNVQQKISCAVGAPPRMKTDETMGREIPV